MASQTNPDKVVGKILSPSEINKLQRDYLNEKPEQIQVWSLLSFKVSRQLLTNDLNRDSTVSLLMTASTTLLNEGLFELTLR